MPGRLRSGLAVFSALVISGLMLIADRSGSLSFSPTEVLAAHGPLRWYRGNIHTHTLWSDGDDYPEMVALWYKEHGYDFLSFSDHNTFLDHERWIAPLALKCGQKSYDKLKARFPEDWVEERTNANGNLEIRLKTLGEIAGKVGSPGEFLLIQGEEISDHFEKCPIHMNATNLRDLVPPMGGDSVYDVMQRNTDAVVAQRERTSQPMLVHLNHPNYHFGITAEDLARVRGENFFEVYNGHPQVHNDGTDDHASAERIWDIILTRRIAEFQMPLMYGLATDDGHHYHDSPGRSSQPGRGWIVVLARELSPTSIIRSMDFGWFYSSTGVKLDRVAASPRGYEVRIQPEEGVEYTIDFIGTRTGFDTTSEPVLDEQGNARRATRRYSTDVGRVLKTFTGTKARYTFTDDDLYVRARVTSTKLHPNPSAPGEYERAWCQPMRGPAGCRHRSGNCKVPVRDPSLPNIRAGMTKGTRTSRQP